MTERLLGVCRVELRVTLLTAALTSVAILFALGGLCLVVESLLFLQPAAKVVVAALFAAGLAAPLFPAIVRVLSRRGAERGAAVAEGRFPNLGGRVRGSLELWKLRTGSIEGYSSELIDAAIVQAEQVSRCIVPTLAVDRAALLRSGRAAGALGLCLILGLLVFPARTHQALGRLVHPLTAYARPPQTTFGVSPGDIRMRGGRDVVIEVKIGGKIPKSITFLSRPLDGGDWSSVELGTAGRDSLAYAVRDVSVSFAYRVRAGRDETDTFVVRVVDYPIVQKVVATCTPPSYTRASATVQEGGHISAPVGTAVTVEAWASKPLRSAELFVGEAGPVACEVAGNSILTRLTVSASTSYHFSVTDLVGQVDPEPVSYAIEALSDIPPSVEIIEPGEDTDIAEGMLLPLLIQAEDDFGLSRLEIIFQSREGAAPTSEEVALPPGSRASLRVGHAWDLRRLSLLPGDRVTYFAQVFDNDAISGPKVARSRTFVVRFPSIEEIFKAAEEEQAASAVDMETMIQDSKLLKDHIERISRDLRKDQNPGWAQKRDVEAALEKQRKMASEMDALAERLGETIDRMENSSLIDPGTITKLDAIRKLMAEVATPELRNSMDRLRRAMESLSPEEVRRAMQDFALNQKEFQERLDRTLAILKRLQIEQRMEAAVKKAAELLSRQQGINKEALDSKEGANQEGLASREEDVKSDLDRLGSDLGSLADQIETTLDTPASGVGKVGERIQHGETVRRMARTAQQMRAGQISAARSSGMENAADLEGILSELRSSRSALASGQKARISREIRQVEEDLLYLSERQETASRSTFAKAERRELDLASEQQQSLVSGASRTADRLFDIAQKTLFVSPAVGQALGRSLVEMQDALKLLETGRQSDAGAHQRDAMVALNEVVILLRQAMQSMAGSQSELGFAEMAERMQGMMGRQESISRAMESLRKGQGLSMEERALMARLAAEQEAVRKAVEEMAGTVRERSGVRSRLEELAREMREAVSDLTRQQIDPSARQRQERILSRMLDAIRSVHERDEEKRRQARSGRDRPYRGPASLPDDLGERPNVLRENLDGALKEGYRRADEGVVRRYFESLMKRELSQ